jgi:hypothetical protein
MYSHLYRMWKVALYLSFVVVALASVTSDAGTAARKPIVNQEVVDRINAGGFPWTASTKQGSTVEGADEVAIKRLLGVKIPKGQTQAQRDLITPPKVFTPEELAAEVPASFDASAKWPQCSTITHIRDQSACGSCWAVAAAESISDRYCTYGGPKDLLISAADIMECCSYCGQGCEGGQPGLAWSFWRSYGLVSDQCQPYPFPKCEHHIPQNHYPPCPKNAYPTPQCPGDVCNSTGVSNKVYKGKNSWSVQGVRQFQQELMTNGPFEVTFSVYADFPNYKGGVYVQTSQHYLGGHAVKVVGWGTLNGVPYWRIANSWNTDWGLDGYFLIRRGTDECGIEDGGTAGEPELP